MEQRVREQDLLSIGALSRSSGVAVETLRNWERRYGFPVPSRLGSGHRRYAWDVAARLKLVKRALDLGYRPSFALQASEARLTELLDDAPRVSTTALADGDWVCDGPLSPACVDAWISAATAFDVASLELRVRTAWNRHGARDVLLRLMVPFLRLVGARWSDGTLTVAHEHFASATLEAFLAEQWRPLARTARGPAVVLANLEGELHSLPLHMAAVFLALAGFRLAFLGASTPRRDIAATALGSGADVVVIGTSPAADPARTAAELLALRGELPPRAALIIGGAARLPSIPGVSEMESLDAFSDWVEARAALPGEAPR